MNEVAQGHWVSAAACYLSEREREREKEREGERERGGERKREGGERERWGHIDGGTDRVGYSDGGGMC